MGSIGVDSTAIRSGRYFHLFVYGASPEFPVTAGGLEGCEFAAPGEVTGTLYEIEDDFPALVLAGPGRVSGEVWRCPVEVLSALDTDERVQARQLRRVGVEVGEFACWVYVVGPQWARQVVGARRPMTGRGHAAGVPGATGAHRALGVQRAPGVRRAQGIKGTPGIQGAPR